MRPGPAFAILVSLAAACGEPTHETTGGGGGSGGMRASGGGGAGGGSGGCTPQRGVMPGPDWICVTSAEGTVVDETDAPLPGVLMTVCGPGGCEPDETDDEGRFHIDVGFELLPDDFSLIPHSRELGKHPFYFPFDENASGPVIDVGTVRLLDYPASGDPLVVASDMAGAPAQTVTNGDVTLEVPDGVRVNLDFEDVSLGEAGKQFRARKVPDALLDEFVDPSLGAAGLYAMTPFDASFDLASNPGTLTKARLQLDNTLGLAADTPVELWQLGSFIVGDIEAGDYGLVATGTVSSDGSTIAFDPGEGIEFLTWIAVVEGG